LQKIDQTSTRHRPDVSGLQLTLCQLWCQLASSLSSQFLFHKHGQEWTTLFKPLKSNMATKNDTVEIQGPGWNLQITRMGTIAEPQGRQRNIDHTLIQNLRARSQSIQLNRRGPQGTCKNHPEDPANITGTAKLQENHFMRQLLPLIRAAESQSFHSGFLKGSYFPQSFIQSCHGRAPIIID